MPEQHRICKDAVVHNVEQLRHCGIFRTVTGGHDWRVDVGDTHLPWHTGSPKGLGRQAVAEKLVVHCW